MASLPITPRPATLASTTDSRQTGHTPEHTAPDLHRLQAFVKVVVVTLGSSIPIACRYSLDRVNFRVLVDFA
jgi:hypothetical protein